MLFPVTKIWDKYRSTSLWSKGFVKISDIVNCTFLSLQNRFNSSRSALVWGHSNIMCDNVSSQVQPNRHSGEFNFFKYIFMGNEVHQCITAWYFQRNFAPQHLTISCTMGLWKKCTVHFSNKMHCTFLPSLHHTFEISANKKIIHWYTPNTRQTHVFPLCYGFRNVLFCC